MITLKLDEIRAHWQDWATKYGTELRATTKTSTVKAIEIDALRRAIRTIETELGSKLRILEVGCGNGQNCLALSCAFPEAIFTGIDFIAEMVDAANCLKKDNGISDERLLFQEGNVLELNLPEAYFDVIFTDRCLINLNTDSLQQQAIKSLSEKLKDGGYLLMIENSQLTYNDQNSARTSVGLAPRTPAEFNHFFDEEILRPFLPTVGLQLFDVEDFVSLHDLVLYVLVPMINGGVVDYDHPIVDAAAKLNIALSSERPNGLGAYGQNRLFKCRKTPKDSV
jgi:ubiquinone/menaquinone biosynthesis C-methylase UbiE